MVITKLFEVCSALMMLTTAPAFADFIVKHRERRDNASDGVCSLREAIIAGQQPGELQ